ncbi:MAG: hypothetical protein DBY41_04580 [Clostridium sp.]|nr:MAG: hypothetical protein DBY41_04580 [Clostridium sp.]
MKNEIISNLNCGWADFCLGLGYHERISFIRDIPEDILNGVSSFKATGIGAIEFDCEGWTFTLLMKEGGCLIIEEKNDIQIFEIDEIPNDICLNLFNSVKNHVEEWVEFQNGNETKEFKESYKKQIQSRIKIIELMEDLEIYQKLKG